jgi:hypothetical protein
MADRANNSTPSMASLPCPTIPGRAFGRFDEITDLVEKASALTHAVSPETNIDRDPS